VIAVAFSAAEGIFHPYYTSQLAPFTAALVGAAVGVALRGGPAARMIVPLAIAGGVITERMVLADNPGQLDWVSGAVLLGGLGAAAALALVQTARLRVLAVATAMAVLLIAPGTWAVQTLGHPTNGTFPAGGPETAGFGGGPGGFGGARGGFGGPPAAANGTAGGFGGGRGFGGFGGDTSSLAAAVAYTKAHGGGTIVIGSQSGASAQVIAGATDVAGIGGFSGRESEVSLTWLADAVEHGRIRWAITDGQGVGLPQDGRVGASRVLAVAGEVGKPVSSVSGLVDLQGTAAALRAAAAA